MPGAGGVLAQAALPHPLWLSKKKENSKKETPAPTGPPQGRLTLGTPLPPRHAARGRLAAEAGSAAAEAGLSWRGGVAGEAGKRGAILVPAPGTHPPPPPVPRQHREPPPGRAREGASARGGPAAMGP